MISKKKILSCQNNAKKKRLTTLEKVEIALKALSPLKIPLTVAKLATVSGVSKAWFYNDKEIKELFIGRLTPEGANQLLYLIEVKKNITKSNF